MEIVPSRNKICSTDCQLRGQSEASHEWLKSNDVLQYFYLCSSSTTPTTNYSKTWLLDDWHLPFLVKIRDLFTCIENFLYGWLRKWKINEDKFLLDPFDPARKRNFGRKSHNIKSFLFVVFYEHPAILTSTLWYIFIKIFDHLNALSFLSQRARKGHVLKQLLFKVFG